MRPYLPSAIHAICLSALLVPTIHPAVAGPAEIGPQAGRILREMGNHLKTAGQFAFQAQVTYDAVTTDGQKIQYGGIAKVFANRPSQLRFEFDGDERQSRGFFSGRTFTFFDVAQNVYSVMEVPSKIDDAQDLVFEKYGFSVPIADLVYAEPYQVLMKDVRSGFLVGLHSVDGTACHHLAFRQETIDWQIWIEDGPRPLPRKLLIAYKNQPGSPQYTARLSSWDFEPRLSDSSFEFRRPAGADEIEFLPLQGEEIIDD
jgi:hypothetical protein